METMKLISHIGSDGILLLQMPTEFKDTSVEVVVVVQTLPSEEIKQKYNAWGELTTKNQFKPQLREWYNCGKKLPWIKAQSVP